LKPKLPKLQPLYVHHKAVKIYHVLCVIPGFRRKADWNCALLGNYAAISGNSLPTFRDNLTVTFSGLKNPKEGFGFLNPEDGTERLSRNVGKELPLLAA
jgi:hypothetical protein